jgi:hypothetical protein
MPQVRSTDSPFSAAIDVPGARMDSSVAAATIQPAMRGSGERRM